MSALDHRERSLLLEISRKGIINALLFSPYRDAGPSLRAKGMVSGHGDATALTLDGELDLGEDEADSDTYRPMWRHNKAPYITVGDLRAARDAFAKATGGAA